MLRIWSASVSSSRLPKNCTREQHEQGEGAAGGQREGDQDADREQRLGRGEQQLDALLGVDRQAVEGAAEIAKTIGIVPTSSVHWLTLLDSSVPSESDALSRHANRHATISSGASLAAGPPTARG